MRKEILTTAIIYIFVAILFGGSFFLKSIKISKNIIKPTGKPYSVLTTADRFPLPEFLIYGFLPYWSLEKAEHFQYDKLTDIAYFALSINKNGTIEKYDEDGSLLPGYQNWHASEVLDDIIVKAQRNSVRFALTIISHDDDTTYSFLNCEKCWTTFADSLKKELKLRAIKDVNIDFELADEPSDPSIAEKYTKFVGFVNRELDKEYVNSFVVVSTFADSNVKPRITEIAGLSKTADALFIMGYDFHRPTSDNAGPVSPIGGAGTLAEYDLSSMLKDYLVKSPSAKLILGVPYYGYNWVVYNPVPYSQRLIGNEHIGYSGSQTYAHIMETVLNYNPKIFWDDTAQVPYFTYISDETGSTREVYFDNIKSLKAKYNLIKQSNLLGVGIWALGYDGGYQELWNLLAEEFPKL